jgi:hypothetical protein
MRRREFIKAFATAAAGWTLPAAAQTQSDTRAAYDDALSRFKSILGERRAQIASHQLPSVPGQAVYLARVAVMSTYKDLTDEYRRLFDLMEAPPAGAQNSATPFKDVVDLGIAIARAKGLDAANAEVAGRVSLGMFFAETDGRQNIGNARSNTYKGSLQTGPAEDRNGQTKWAAIRPAIRSPEVIARDDREEARVGNMDHRYNHWTAVRDGLANAHADLFLQIPAIVRTLPDPIDQMKLFELIQIIPSPTKASSTRSGAGSEVHRRPNLSSGVIASGASQEFGLPLRFAPGPTSFPNAAAR